jgi:hypothetical protein
VGGAAGITFALRRPGATVEPQKIAAPASASTGAPAGVTPIAPPTGAPAEGTPPPAKAAEAPAAKEVDDVEAEQAAKTGVATGADTRAGKLKAAKSKGTSSKSHRHPPKRKDPVKW